MQSQVLVRHSGIWQLTSVVLPSKDGCVVIDPGYFPRELDELAQLAAQHGGAQAVVFTHGHWDHVIGHAHFPQVPVWSSPSLVQAVTQGLPVAHKNLAEAQEFDGRWYVPRPHGYAWPQPPQLRALAEGQVLTAGELQLQALLLPGHSSDGLALLEPQRGLLLVGDYLSPCEIPFVEDAAAYVTTLQRLLGLCDQVAQVLPGHGPPLSASQARAIAQADLQYLQQLLACQQRGAVTEALALTLPRAAQVPGMAQHHLDNCRAVGLTLP